MSSTSFWLTSSLRYRSSMDFTPDICIMKANESLIIGMVPYIRVWYCTTFGTLEKHLSVDLKRELYWSPQLLALNSYTNKSSHVFALHSITKSICKYFVSRIWENRSLQKISTNIKWVPTKYNYIMNWLPFCESANSSRLIIFRF